MKLVSLTGLRGVASLWVFLFHASLGLGAFVYPGATPEFIKSGFLGVHIFFILSGFILAFVHPRDFDVLTSASYVRFLLLRLARVYPLHLFALLVMLVLVLGLPGFRENYNPASLSGLNFVANLFLVQHWIIPVLPLDIRPPGWSWNAPAWTLSVEWALYLGFPILMTILARVVMVGRLLLALAACLLAPILLLTLVLQIQRLEDISVAAGMVLAVLEFATGACLARLMQSVGRDAAPWSIFAWAGVALTVITGCWPQTQALSMLGYTLLIAGTAWGQGPVARLLSLKITEFLGEISYSLYLLHWIVLQVFGFLARNHGLADQPFALRLAVFVFYIVIVLGLSILCYYRLERPARAWGRRLALRFGPGVVPATVKI